jgi:hypothetical protein
MAEIVPESERERRYDRWYELTKLYHQAVRHGVEAKEIASTKDIADEAWQAYVEVVTNNLTGRFEGYETPQGPR